jgi:hypothetical protein
MSRANLLLCASHLVGNALLLWLGYYWLGIGESDGVHLATNAVVILIFGLGALWLHGTALVQFSRQSGLSFFEAGGLVLRHSLPLFVLALVVAAVYGLLAYWYGSFVHNAFLIGSSATMTIRKPVSPTRVLAWFHGLIWLLRWMVVPVLAFPLAARIAVDGWAGFRWRAPRVLYWVEVCALLLCAVWAPFQLLNWIPRPDAFSLQMASFLARIGFGYLLFVAGLLAIEFLTSAGKPRRSQVSSVASP